MEGVYDQDEVYTLIKLEAIITEIRGSQLKVAGHFYSIHMEYLSHRL